MAQAETPPRPSTKNQTAPKERHKNAGQSLARHEVNLSVALGLAEQGLPIFPAVVFMENGEWKKQPLIKGWQTQATDDPARIRRWFKKYRNAVPGIELGGAGFLVVDADRHGGPDGVAALGRLETVHEPLPPHPVVNTPGNGEHHIFAQPDIEPLGNSPGELPAGIDVRGRGGWIVAPGAVRPDGRRWEPISDFPIVDAPPLPHWLEAIIRAKQTDPPTRNGEPLVLPFRRPEGASNRERAWAHAALQNLVRELMATPQGRRNIELNNKALRLGSIAAHGWITKEEALAALVEAASFAGLPEKEIKKTFESGFNKGLETPCEGPRDRQGHTQKANGHAPKFANGMANGHDAEAVGEGTGRPIIKRAGGDLSDVTTEAEKHLIKAGVPFYQRAGRLVRPVADVVTASNGRKTVTAALVPVTETYMRDQIGRHIEWQSYRRREKEWVTIDAPRDVAETLLGRQGEWGFRSVSGIMTTQTLRPDGTIISEPGFDDATGLLLIDPPKLPPIPDKPSREEALAALATLNDLLSEFPFVDDASRSVALSAIITPVVRGHFPVPPCHVARAPTASSGKSFLFDLVSAIAVGQPCNVIAAGRTEEETEKRLGACVLAGHPLVNIDNVNGELGGDFLCQVTERPVISPRILGRSEQPQIQNRMTVFATGNNITLVGDMTRRSLICQLDPRVERPELRTFASNPLAKILADRGRYVAAALTIVRAYLVAGDDKVKPKTPLGSYSAWSNSVRGALIWLGCADPVDTMARARAEDPRLQGLSAMLAAWADAIGTGPGAARTTNTILNEAMKPGNEALKEVIEATGVNASKSPARALGTWLRDHKERIVNGLRFVSRSTTGHAATWWVERVEG